MLLLFFLHEPNKIILKISNAMINVLLNKLKLVHPCLFDI